MERIVSKNKIIFSIILFILICISLYFCISIHNLNNKINLLSNEIKDIKTNNYKNNKSDDILEKSAAINRINKYGVSLIQIGGAGSRMIQTTVYNLEHQEYFTDYDNWVSYSLNNPADLLWADCRNGYKMTSCKLDEQGIELQKLKPVCGVELLQNVPQNKIILVCIKE